MFVLISILTSLVAQSIGLLIGAGMSVETGEVLLLIFLVNIYKHFNFQELSLDLLVLFQQFYFLDFLLILM
jgi:hypothetical protein